LQAQRIPPDVLEGYERRVLAVEIPAAKLPEIIQLRAIGRELMQHINTLEEEQRLRAGVTAEGNAAL